MNRIGFNVTATKNALRGTAKLFIPKYFLRAKLSPLELEQEKARKNKIRVEKEIGKQLRNLPAAKRQQYDAQIRSLLVGGEADAEAMAEITKINRLAPCRDAPEFTEKMIKMLHENPAAMGLSGLKMLRKCLSSIDAIDRLYFIVRTVHLVKKGSDLWDAARISQGKVEWGRRFKSAKLMKKNDIDTFQAICKNTPRCFENAAKNRLLIRAKASIEGTMTTVYVKGFKPKGSIRLGSGTKVAYEPTKNVFYAIKTEQGRIIDVEPSRIMGNDDLRALVLQQKSLEYKRLTGFIRKN